MAGGKRLPAAKYKADTIHMYELLEKLPVNDLLMPA
jgi:hypothetical protein